ncbi:MAG: Asp-tRNA(Asn)/Glu-tRNA(Gln) amidotransferase subunit GatC [Candidatus Pacebacteria bacterium]|nr:Asp-tRNA(Asn)/Glu-tRNA(Gln) amidotransferase subunit GatC [Candidatus Paceibacterota bacterium]NCQ65200.1 Asp-tRNA(Asn)/Glu-tRNA(Gln) amidotransferase subunit GatC [Candidatus Paceibacterota bacterium]NCS87079.1 Asp-tRNA(Asn)/Glu-tRNA(Gln) amidotransferase subunit GatC [Candidatus Paceibacterota bacterium]PJC43859.1 MAG: Asp-tRNA(Asn)/Glu-tRNA(Gln) amidotransferase GatCAB subunit C [Candidatus Pacebacteria bacterium CG_4_9_14_0_2_um_filter_34_50]
MSNKITTAQIKHIAELAFIPITEEEENSLIDAFEETLDVISELQSVDVSGVEPTSQVTGFENVLREDIINKENMFSQADALKNAKETYDGYFVVPRIIDEK